MAFGSLASNLVAGDTNGKGDVFVRDRLNGTTELVSVSSVGAQGDGDSANPAISADGRFVAYDSIASNLDGPDTNGREDVFVRDRLLGLTTRVSRTPNGGQGNGNSAWASITPGGRYVVFASDASNLIAIDSNGA